MYEFKKHRQRNIHRQQGDLRSSDVSDTVFFNMRQEPVFLNKQISKLAKHIVKN